MTSPSMQIYQLGVILISFFAGCIIFALLKKVRFNDFFEKLSK